MIKHAEGERALNRGGNVRVLNDRVGRGGEAEKVALLLKVGLRRLRYGRVR